MYPVSVAGSMQETDLSCQYFDENRAYAFWEHNVMSANAVFLSSVCANLFLLDCK